MTMICILYCFGFGFLFSIQFVRFKEEYVSAEKPNYTRFAVHSILTDMKKMITFNYNSKVVD
jgi:hypothetical protein